MTYCFIHQHSYNDTVRETSVDISEGGTHLLATSLETVSDYKNYCREVCYKVLCDESRPQIGGPGKEIDESLAEGQWVLVGFVIQIEHFFYNQYHLQTKKL